MIRFFFTVFIVIFVSSCTQQTTKNESFDPLSHKNQQDYEVIKPDSQTGDAVISLLVDARGAASSGNIDRAEALLERALRIEPRNAVLWHYMAKMKLHQGRYSKAIGMAAKSNSFVKGNKKLMADNWRIIAHAENWLGNIDKSRKAQESADKLIQ
ncbi:MAG: tetratricopeptide repeat protein [Gammaproteobacteria bacterium]